MAIETLEGPALESVVGRVTGTDKWKNGDPTARRGEVRNFVMEARKLGVPAEQLNPLSDRLYSEAGSLGAVGWTKQAVVEGLKSIPAGGAALAGTVTDFAGITDTGSKARLNEGILTAADSLRQRTKQLAPNDEQEKRDKVWEFFKKDLDAGAYPEGLMDYLSGNPSPQAQQGSDYFGKWQSVTLKTAIGADSGRETVPQLYGEHAQYQRGLYHPQARELLADYIATRDPASWDALQRLGTETGTQWKTRLRAENDPGDPRSIRQAIAAEGRQPNLLEDLALKSGEFQTSPVDMGLSLVPFVKGVQALEAVRSGRMMAAVKNTAFSATSEALSGAASSALEDPRNTAGQIAESGAQEAVGGGVTTGGMAVLGKIMQRFGRPAEQTAAPVADPSALPDKPASPSMVEGTDAAPAAAVPAPAMEPGTAALPLPADEGDPLTLLDSLLPPPAETPPAAPAAEPTISPEALSSPPDNILELGDITAATPSAVEGTPGENLITPGTVDTAPAPDTVETVTAQAALAADPASARAAVLITPGTPRPEKVPGLQPYTSPHGLVLFNPRKITKNAVIAASNGNVFDARALGLSGQPVAAGTTAVTASLPGAPNVQAELVASPDQIPAAMAAAQAAAPGAAVEVKPAAEVLSERQNNSPVPATAAPGPLPVTPTTEPNGQIQRQDQQGRQTLLTPEASPAPVAGEAVSGEPSPPTEEDSGRRYTLVKIMPKTGRRVPQDGLDPMTHREAVTFRSKMMDPVDWRIEEVPQDSLAPDRVQEYTVAHGAHPEDPAQPGLAAALVRSGTASYQQGYLFGDAAPAPAAAGRRGTTGARTVGPGRGVDPATREDAAQRFRDFTAGKAANFDGEGRISSVMADMIDGKIPGFDIRGKKINNPGDFALLLQPLRTPLFESVKVAVVDEATKRVVHSELIHVGSVNEAVLSPARIVQVLEHARRIGGHKGRLGIIYSHNHPSGNVDPSNADRQMTGKVQDAVKAAGSYVIDHIITNGTAYYSFANFQEHWLTDMELADWESVSTISRPSITSEADLTRYLGVLRQGNGNRGHLLLLDTRLGIMAAEILTGQTTEQITRQALTSAARIGAANVMIDLAHLGPTLPVGRMAREIRAAMEASSLRLTDMASSSIDSFAAAGLLEPAAEYRAGLDGFVREPSGSKNSDINAIRAGFKIGPVWRSQHEEHKGKIRARQDDGFIFFSDSKEAVSTYDRGDSPDIIRAFLKLRNPLTIDGKGSRWDSLDGAVKENPSLQDTDDISYWAQQNGYDGVIFKNIVDDGMSATDRPGPPSTIYAIFDRTQARKSQSTSADAESSMSDSGSAKTGETNTSQTDSRVNNGIIREPSAEYKAPAVPDGYDVNRFGIGVQADERIRDAWRATFTPRLYKTFTFEELTRRINAWIGENGGLEGAAALFLDPNVPMEDYARNALGQVVAQGLDVRARRAEAAGNAAATAEAEAAFDAVINHLETLGTKAGQALAAFRMWGGFSPRSVVRAAERRNAEVRTAAAETSLGTTPEAVVAAAEEILRPVVEAAKQQQEKAERNVVQEWIKKLAESQSDTLTWRTRKTLSALEKLIRAHVKEVNPAFATEAAALGVPANDAAVLDRLVLEEHRRKQRIDTAAAADRLDVVQEWIKKLAESQSDTLTWRTRKTLSALEKLIRAHVKEVNPAFATEAAALGVPANDAAVLDRLVLEEHRRKQRIDTAAAADRLVQQLTEMAPGSKARKAIPKLVEALLKAAERGIITRADFLEAYARAFDLPLFDREFAAAIRQQVERTQAAPEGSWLRQKDQSRLMAMLALHEGIPSGAIWWAYWYANILSGAGTQVVNLTGNATHLLLGTFQVFLTNHPRHWMPYISGMLQGAAEGSRQARAAFVNGEPVMRGNEEWQKQDVLELLWSTNPDTWGRKIAKYGAASWGRYVFRALTAADSLFWNTAKEGRAWLEISRRMAKGGDIRRAAGMAPDQWADAQTQAAAELAKLGKRSTRDIDRRAFEIVEAKREAEVTHTARKWGSRMTYNYEPEGTMGAVSEVVNLLLQRLPAARLAMPFVRIVANITDVNLDWTPVGFFRAFKGGHLLNSKGEKFTRAERNERYVSSVTGTLGVAALWALANANQGDDDERVPFMIYGLGPRDPGRRSQMPEGWQPFSMKIGGTYIKFDGTPLAFLLGTLGTAMDQTRYSSRRDAQEAGSKAFALLTAAPQTLLNSGVLSGLNQTFEMFSGARKPGAWAERTAASLIPMGSLMKDIATAIDPVKVDSNHFGATFLSYLPVLRGKAEPLLNVFGEPVKAPGPWLISRIVTRQAQADPDALWLTKNGLRIPGMDNDVAVGTWLTDRDKPQSAGGLKADRAFRAEILERLSNGYLTPEERTDFLKQTGPQVRKAITILRHRAAAGDTIEQKDVTSAIQAIRRRGMKELIK